MISKIIEEILKSPLKKLTEEVGNELQQIAFNRLLEFQVYEYELNSSVKTVLSDRDPKPLYDVYQHLYIRKINKKDAVYSDSIKKVFKNEKFITILGDAGSGKSMLVKHLLLSAIKEKYRYPIKIELRSLNNSEKNLHDYISDDIFRFNELANSSRIINRLLLSGRFVFFFDGYDEVKSDKKELITSQIESFVKKYNKNRFIITSRMNTGIEHFPQFHNYYIQAFKRQEIEAFILKQLKPNEKLARKIIDTVNDSKNEAYKSFLRNPLLLSMFILSYDTYASLPSKRSVFYSNVFDTLLSIHDSKTKKGFSREMVSGLSKDDFREAIKILSFLSYFKIKSIFTIQELYDYLDDIKKKKKDLYFENDKFVQDLAVSIGILKYEGLDVAFTHQSLQEYFASLYISKLREESKKRTYEIINKRINIKYSWIEYYSDFLILLKEVDERYMLSEFLLPMLNEYQRHINSGQLEKLSNNELVEFYLSKFQNYSIFFNVEESYAEIEESNNKLLISTYREKELRFKRELRNNVQQEGIYSSIIPEIKHQIVLFKDYMEVAIKEYKDIIDSRENEDESFLDMIE